MAKKPRKAKAKAEPSKEVASLLPALEFVGVAAKDKGEPYAAHLYLGYGWAMAFNGITCVAHPIADDIEAVPDAFYLIDALKRAKGSVTLTVAENGRLNVRAEKFRVSIPCLRPDEWPIMPPDPPVAVIGPELMNAFNAVAKISSDTAETVLGASVLLRSGSVVATDRVIMCEFWHGIDLPEVAIPKTFITTILKAVANVGASPVKFGFSANSATFYFENGAWFRSQLYSEPWPASWQTILPTDAAKAKPLPVEFWPAFDMIRDFSETGFVYFGHDKLMSAQHDGDGAEYDCPGLAAGPCLSIKRLVLARELFTTFDFNIPDRLLMFGENVRGAMVMTSPVEVAEPAPTAPPIEARGWSSDPSRLASAGPIPAPAGQWVSGIQIDDDIPF